MAQTKILITGATGYTGRYTTETLIEQGFAVRALVHRQDERSERLRSTGAEITIGDMLDLNHDNPPLVIDPFAGGGSIPLEALRLGCEAFASDLNPVACLILKVLLEDIPRHGIRLAEELRRIGSEVKRLAENDLAEFYPPDPDGNLPIAWARTVRCEQPECGAEIPLVRSFWLCKKPDPRRAVTYVVERPKGKPAGSELQAAGIEVKIDPKIYPNGRFAPIHDPEGNPIELWQSVKPGG